MRFIIILFLFFSLLSVRAQNYTMYWNANSLFNPAASGIHYKYNVALIGKDYLAGFNDAPVSMSAIYDMKLEALHGGVGINYHLDKYGLTKNRNVNVNYCYHINLPNERIMSFGLSGGINSVKNDFSSFINPSTSPYPDPSIPNQEKFTLFNFKTGLYFASKHLDLGLSSTHVSGYDKSNFGYASANDYWLTGSYSFDLGKGFDLKPHFLVKTSEFNEYSLSTYLLVMYGEIFWTGISYTIDTSLGFMFGFDIARKVRIGYCYDKSTYLNRTYNNGNHEIVLAFMLK